jgi:hypothetical protein
VEGYGTRVGGRERERERERACLWEQEYRRERVSGGGHAGMGGWGAAVQVAQSIQRPSGLHVLVLLASAAGDVPGPGRIVVIRVVVVVGAGAGACAALPLGRAVSHGASINDCTGQGECVVPINAPMRRCG